MFLINCFGIELVLCDLYLKRFDLTKGLLFDTFLITVWNKLKFVALIIQYCSLNHLHHRWISRQNKQLQTKCTPEWLSRRFLIENMHRRPEFLWNKMCHRQDFSNKINCQIFYETKCAASKTCQTNLVSQVNLGPAQSSIVCPTARAVLIAGPNILKERCFHIFVACAKTPSGRRWERNIVIWTYTY